MTVEGLILVKEKLQLVDTTKVIVEDLLGEGFTKTEINDYLTNLISVTIKSLV